MASPDRRRDGPAASARHPGAQPFQGDRVGRRQPGRSALRDREHTAAHGREGRGRQDPWRGQERTRLFRGSRRRPRCFPGCAPQALRSGFLGVFPARRRHTRHGSGAGRRSVPWVETTQVLGFRKRRDGETARRGDGETAERKTGFRVQPSHRLVIRHSAVLQGHSILHFINHIEPREHREQRIGEE